MDETSGMKATEQVMIEAIFALDLEAIKFKLMGSEDKDGYSWTPEQAAHYELEYKQFLALLVKYPEEIIVPSKMVDKFWHGHILDTMKYAEDCQNVFGYFLHHFPYMGLRDEADAVNRVRSVDNTRQLYEKEFGGRRAGEASFCSKAEASFCSKAEASFCSKADQQSAKSAQQSTNMNIVLGKGRPKLESALTA